MLKIVIFILFIAIYHPLHLGVLHIDVGTAGSSDISVRVFTDDLANALQHEFNRSVKMNYNDSATVNITDQYIRNHFTIKQKKKTIRLELNSVEPEEDITVFRYQAKVDQHQSMKICCDIFFHLFNDQTNLLMIHTDGNEDGFRLTHTNSCINVNE